MDLQFQQAPICSDWFAPLTFEADPPKLEF